MQWVSAAILAIRVLKALGLITPAKALCIKAGLEIKDFFDDLETFPEYPEKKKPVSRGQDNGNWNQ